MPENERDGLYDASEEYGWDPDYGAPGESEVADLLDDNEDGED